MSRFNRTYSNPDLRDTDTTNYHRYSHEPGCGKPLFVVGDRVYVDSTRAGSVAYFGQLDFAQGDWVGVVLDEPRGQHDGKVHGREYFHCAPNHGILVRPSRVVGLISGELSNQNLNKYSDHLSSGRLSKASSQQTDDSYYYDEDYRASKPRFRLTPASQNYRQQQVTATPGILKTGLTGPRSRSRSISGQSPLRARLDQLSSELAANNNKDSQQQQHQPVLSFRPKRLEPGEMRSESRSSGRSSAGSIPTTTTTTKQTTVNLSSEPLREGDRIVVDSERGQLSGTLRYIGQTNFATGEWAGIELDEPGGRNDGSVLSYRYFKCRDNYGLFVPLTRVQRFERSKPIFSDIRNTIKSPPPPLSATRGSPISQLGGSSSSSPVSPVSSLSSPYSASPYRLSPDERLSTSITKNSERRNKWPLGESLFDELSLQKDSLFDSFGSKLTFDDFYSDDPALERDLDRELERNLSRRWQDKPYHVPKGRPGYAGAPKATQSPATKSVKYTFKSCKYDGNPIALRTVEYER